MRKLKRWISGSYAEWRIKSRREAAARDIQEYLELSTLPSLTRSGSRGHDSNYIVSHDGWPLGVLRLVNPYKKRKPPAANMPFILHDPAARIAREAEIYRQGAEESLTPQALWQADDALLCAYLPLRPLQERFMAEPENAWVILAQAAARLAELHKCGITHMDASLANVLADAGMEQVVFVDFEYAPAAGISAPAQRLYDHLRLVESTWKFIPPEVRVDHTPWFNVFAIALDDEMKAVDIAALAPALGRILGDEAFATRLSRVLSA
jgi:hypothetical protein